MNLTQRENRAVRILVKTELSHLIHIQRQLNDHSPASVRRDLQEEIMLLEDVLEKLKRERTE